MKPTYAHIPDLNCRGTCSNCSFCRAAVTGKIFKKFFWCSKATEITRAPGRGAPIKPYTQGCKFWRFEAKTEEFLE